MESGGSKSCSAINVRDENKGQMKISPKDLSNKIEVSEPDCILTILPLVTYAFLDPGSSASFCPKGS